MLTHRRHSAPVSSVDAKIKSQSRPLAIAEPTNPTYCRDQSPNVGSPRAKAKGKGRIGYGEFDLQEEGRCEHPDQELGDDFGGKNLVDQLLVGNKIPTDEVLEGESGSSDDALLMIRGRRGMRRTASDREREMLRRPSNWAAKRLHLESVERENERKKRWKWEMERLAREKAAREVIGMAGRGRERRGRRRGRKGRGRGMRGRGRGRGTKETKRGRRGPKRGMKDRKRGTRGPRRGMKDRKRGTRGRGRGPLKGRGRGMKETKRGRRGSI